MKRRFTVYEDRGHEEKYIVETDLPHNKALRLCTSLQKKAMDNPEYWNDHLQPFHYYIERQYNENEELS